MSGHIRESRFYSQQEEKKCKNEEEAMQVIYSPPKSKIKAMQFKCKKRKAKSNYRELPAHGQLKLILH